MIKRFATITIDMIVMLDSMAQIGIHSRDGARLAC